MVAAMLNQQTLSGLPAFQRVLELTLPVDDSRELWLKLGHNKFIVGNYSADGHMTAWHTKGSGRNRVRTQLIPDCWEFVSFWAKNNDGGVFFVPTQPQGYPIKEAIAFSDDIAAELDEGTPIEQLRIINSFVTISGLEPAYIIHSGSKSYHPHWKATEHLPIEQTIYLRQLVCIALNSDPAISNPHQPMRIAGFYRREKGREQTLEYSCSSRYTYEQLIAGIRAYFAAKDLPFPESLSESRWLLYKRGRRDGNLDLSILTKPSSELYPKPVFEEGRRQRAEGRSDVAIEPSYTGSIPLELALSKANQEVLQGVGSDRNNTGLALARDLIGCHDWLISNGYSVEGDPYDLFINYCYSCTNGGGWNQREWSTIWRSARRGNPAPARRDLTQFIHWYRWSNDSEYKQAAIAQWRQDNSLTLDKPEKTEHSDFINWLIAKAKGLGKHFKKGFGKYCDKNISVTLPKTIKYDPKIPLPCKSDYEGQQPPLIKFSQGQRHEVIAQLRALGWQFVLDRSFMGTGKSHDMGQFANSNGKTWYLDLNHRNPTTETVERNFNDLSVRHNGLNYDPLRKTPLGNPHEKWASEGDNNPDVLSLCHNAHLFLKLQNKGYPLDSLKDFEEDSNLNPICKSCKFHKWKVDNGNGEKVAICAAKKGDGYGFRASRRQGLTHNQIRASIDSLPDPGDYDYSQDIAIVDEASRLIRGTKQVTASLKDFSTLMVELEQFPSLFNLLKPLREILIPLLSGQEKLPNYYGLNHQEIIDLLPSPPEELEEIIKACASCHPSWQDLSVSPERVFGWGKDWKASMSTANWYLNEEARAMTLENIDNLASNFLVDLLMIWAGLTPGAIRIDNRRHLIVTTSLARHGDTVREMSQVLLLDATGNKQLLAKRLGIEANSIIEIEQELPNLSNLTVVNVEMSGLSSNQWSDTCISRIAALIEHLESQHQDIPILGIKQYADDLELDGWWFNDNRGSNAFKSQRAIAAFGKPQINLGVAEDEYLTLYGNLDGFKDYYQSLIDAEVTQFVGRPRAHLYPDQELVIYLVGTGHQIDYLRSLGINIVDCHAVELCAEAGTLKQVSQYKILKAVKRILQSVRNKLTVATLAVETGLSPDYIKKLIAEIGGMMAFKKWVLSLYESYRSSTRFFDPDSLLADAKIRKWMTLEPVAATKEILEELKTHGWRDFQKYLDQFSIDIQAEIWGLIVPLILPEIAEVEKYHSWAGG